MISYNIIISYDQNEYKNGTVVFSFHTEFILNSILIFTGPGFDTSVHSSRDVDDPKFGRGERRVRRIHPHDGFDEKESRGIPSTQERGELVPDRFAISPKETIEKTFIIGAQ